MCCSFGLVLAQSLSEILWAVPSSPSLEAEEGVMSAASAQVPVTAQRMRLWVLLRV